MKRVAIAVWLVCGLLPTVAASEDERLESIVRSLNVPDSLQVVLHLLLDGKTTEALQSLDRFIERVPPSETTCQHLISLGDAVSAVVYEPGVPSKEACLRVLNAILSGTPTPTTTALAARLHGLRNRIYQIEERLGISHRLETQQLALVAAVEEMEKDGAIGNDESLRQRLAILLNSVFTFGDHSGRAQAEALRLSDGTPYQPAVRFACLLVGRNRDDELGTNWEKRAGTFLDLAEACRGGQIAAWSVTEAAEVYKCHGEYERSWRLIEPLLSGPATPNERYPLAVRLLRQAMGLDTANPTRGWLHSPHDVVRDLGNGPVRTAIHAGKIEEAFRRLRRIHAMRQSRDKDPLVDFLLTFRERDDRALQAWGRASKLDEEDMMRSYQSEPPHEETETQTRRPATNVLTQPDRGDRYLTIACQYPASKLAPLCLWIAAKRYGEACLQTRHVEYWNKLSSKYPQHFLGVAAKGKVLMHRGHRGQGMRCLLEAGKRFRKLPPSVRSAYQYAEVGVTVLDAIATNVAQTSARLQVALKPFLSQQFLRPLSQSSDWEDLGKAIEAALNGNPRDRLSIALAVSSVDERWERVYDLLRKNPDDPHADHARWALLKDAYPGTFLTHPEPLLEILAAGRASTHYDPALQKLRAIPIKELTSDPWNINPDSLKNLEEKVELYGDSTAGGAAKVLLGSVLLVRDPIRARALAKATIASCTVDAITDRARELLLLLGDSEEPPPDALPWTHSAHLQQDATIGRISRRPFLMGFQTGAEPCSLLLAPEGRAFVRTQTGVVAFDPGGQLPLWNVALGPTSDFRLMRDRIVVACLDSRTVVLEADTGRVVNDLRLMDSVDFPVILAEVASEEELLGVRCLDRIAAIRCSDGKLAWSVEVKEVEKHPVQIEDRLFVLCSTGKRGSPYRFLALNLRNGAVIWESKLPTAETSADGVLRLWPERRLALIEGNFNDLFGATVLEPSDGKVLGKFRPDETRDAGARVSVGHRIALLVSHDKVRLFNATTQTITPTVLPLGVGFSPSFITGGFLWTPWLEGQDISNHDRLLLKSPPVESGEPTAISQSGQVLVVLTQTGCLYWYLLRSDGGE